MKTPSRRDQRGFLLVVTLLVVALLTVLVTEFVTAVNTAQTHLHQWRDMQRLSLAARSGVSMAALFIAEQVQPLAYTYPGTAEFPLEKVTSDFTGQILISLEDENAKFNLNALVWPNGTTNDAVMESFKALLDGLDLPETLAERIADWIDRDQEPRRQDYEVKAKNAPLDSLDELTLIAGISREQVEKLTSYCTVFGVDGPTSPLVNINSASIPVLRALHPEMSAELAGRIEAYRKRVPFERISDIVKVSGLEGSLGQALTSRIVVKAVNFHLRVTAEENRLRRQIDCVVTAGSQGVLVKDWREI